MAAALALSAAETAEDYFHHGATNYVFERLQQARQAVKAGLAKFPQDRLLLELDKLLNPPPQPQQSQNQQDQQQQQQQQENAGAQQDQSQDQNKADQSPQPQQPERDATQPQSDKPQPDQGSAQSQPRAAEDQRGQRPETQAEQAGQDAAQSADLRPGQMTPDEARQLLDRHRSEERLLLFTPPPTNRLRRPLKDW